MSNCSTSLNPQIVISASNPKKDYFTEINYLRGLAIFFIVYCHMRGWIGGNSKADWSSTWWIFDNVRATLVDGASSLFVFISGFLFYHIFYKRGFDYKKFLTGKVKKVLCPWFIIATLFAAFRLISKHGSFFDSNFMFYGCYVYASFWYVPFIMVVFCCSCLYLKFIELRLRYQMIVFAISLFVSMGMGRHNGNAFLSAFFWNSIYLFGILVGIYYDKLKNLDKTSKQCIIAGTVMVMAALACSGDRHYLADFGTYDLKFHRIEWMVIGKMMLCLTLVYCFSWFKDAGWKWLKWCLNILAKYSFSIFFIHQFALLHLERHGHKVFFSHFNFYGLHLMCFLIAIAVCTVCIIIAAVIKRATGKYSRMIIGS